MVLSGGVIRRICGRYQVKAHNAASLREGQIVKVFISWSGSNSHKVAVILRDWLPSVIQTIKPYVSSEDIDKGARWSSDIAAELDASSYGIICLTPDNVDAPWINFEAGALGKSVEKSRVSPFLFRLKRSEVDGPLLQFQSTVVERDDVLKLLRSMNLAAGAESLEEGRLEKAYSVWWPNLEEELNAIPAPPVAQPSPIAPDPGAQLSKVLEELLDLTRTNHKILRDPAALIPPNYIEHVVMGSSRRHELVDPGALEEIIVRYRDVLKFISKARTELEKTPEMLELLELIERVDRPLRYLSRNFGMRLPRDVLLDKGAP